MDTTLLLYILMTVTFSMIFALKIVLAIYAVRNRRNSPWSYIYLGLCVPTAYFVWISIEGILEIAGRC